MAAPRMKIEVEHLNLYYGDRQALFDVTLAIAERQVTALIGPSGCGKSSFLRCLNRLNDFVAGARVTGRVRIDGQDIYDRRVDPVEVRRRVGMVFQRPNPFPMSIFDNVAYGPRIHGVRSLARLQEIVERSLRRAALWDEVKGKLRRSALELSGGQQQRLCIARALAVSPEVLLMDEPASALDPISTGKIEELITELRRELTIVVVTHNLAQAGRVADVTAFFLEGRLIEVGPTERLFQAPADERTERYVTGRLPAPPGAGSLPASR